MMYYTTILLLKSFHLTFLEYDHMTSSERLINPHAVFLAIKRKRLVKKLAIDSDLDKY